MAQRSARPHSQLLVSSCFELSDYASVFVDARGFADDCQPASRKWVSTSADLNESYGHVIGIPRENGSANLVRRMMGENGSEIEASVYANENGSDLNGSARAHRNENVNGDADLLARRSGNESGVQVPVTGRA